MSIPPQGNTEILPSGEIRAVAGDRVEFTCQVVGARPAVSVHWYMDDEILPPEVYTQLEETSDKKGYLINHWLLL